MRKTVLFDLDGTLLPINTDEFLRHYMKALAAHAGHLVPPQALVEQVMASTYAMIRNVEPDKTNADVFAADFFPRVGRTEEELMPVFDQFYRERFPALVSAIPGAPGLAKRVVQAVLDQGCEIVLATNPLFPRMAIEERMRWIEVDKLPWRLVTTYEEMHACKPQPEYYREILAKIGREPGDCLMVGNDFEEDGVAAKVGLDVFFVTDFLIKRSDAPLPEGRSGTLAEFLERVENGGLV